MPKDLFEYVKKGPIDLFYNVENKVNDNKRFAIAKTTMNGKYMRDNLLYYNLNGVEVYTESTNIIFVDLYQNSLFIKKYDKVDNNINISNAEQKKYIILYVDLGFETAENEFPLRWESITGRQETYENIKVNASIIDIDKSLVLSETVSIKDALTVREFMNYMKNGNLINDNEDFDINDYSNSEYI